MLSIYECKIEEREYKKKKPEINIESTKIAINDRSLTVEEFANAQIRGWSIYEICSMMCFGIFDDEDDIERFERSVRCHDRFLSNVLGYLTEKGY